MKIQKIISGLALFITVTIYIIFAPQPVYSDTVGYESAKLLSKLGIFYIKEDMSDKELSDFLKEKTTKTIAYNAAFGLTGGIITPNTETWDNTFSIRFLKSENLTVYNNMLDTMEQISSTTLTSSDCYRILLDVLGYNSLYLNNEEVLDRATKAGFGYIQPVEDDESITNGVLLNIVLEALYLCGYNTGIPTIHTLSQINPDLLSRALELGMIDVFPNTIPQFTEGPYRIGTFLELSGTDVTTNVSKNELSATYVNVTLEGYEKYKEKLENTDWILEVELNKETSDKQELLILYYKEIDETEHYVTLVLNEETKTIELWYAY